MTFDETIPSPPSEWLNNRLHFFKYMRGDTARAVVDNRTLRWSTAATLNDPFELQLQISIDNIDLERVKTKVLENIWQLYSGKDPIPAGNQFGFLLEVLRVRCPGLSKEALMGEFSDGIDESFEITRRNSPKNQRDVMEILSPIKILSLTISPDIPLMWSHYANSHYGVVLRFRSIPAFDSPFGMAKPVVYTDVRPTFFTEEYLINSLSGLTGVDTKSLNEKVIYTKMTEWAYEKEWRISAGDGRDKQAPFEDLPFGANELDGIIFGSRTPEADRISLRSLAQPYPNIEWMEAVQNHANGKIEIRTI